MARLDIALLDTLEDASERRFWTLFDHQLARRDVQAARTHLEEGRPIFYCSDDRPGDLIREWPDGTLESVDIDVLGIVSSIGRC